MCFQEISRAQAASKHEGRSSNLQRTSMVGFQRRGTQIQLYQTASQWSTRLDSRELSRAARAHRHSTVAGRSMGRSHTRHTARQRTDRERETTAHDSPGCSHQTETVTHNQSTHINLESSQHITVQIERDTSHDTFSLLGEQIGRNAPTQHRLRRAPCVLSAHARGTCDARIRPQRPASAKRGVAL